jgi:hypothetical protein
MDRFVKPAAIVVLFAGLIAAGAGTASANPAPQAIGWEGGLDPNNPFCPAVGWVVAWDRRKNVPASDGASDEYALFLWVKANSEFSARLTLVDSTSAFSVDIPRVTIPIGDASRNVRWPFLISFDHPLSIRYDFVDSVGIDENAMTDCPSFVQTVSPMKTGDASEAQESSGFGILSARFVQNLPPLSCANMYAELKIPNAVSPLVGHYGDLAKSTEVEVFVDSSGAVVETRISKSSGVEGLDAAALGGSQQSTYKPAQFLCTPVVSEGFLTFDYQP